MRTARKLIYAIPFLMTLSVLAQNPGSKTPFYQDRERGWFWHEEPVVEEDDSPEQPAQSSSSASKEPDIVKLDVEWMRENLPKLMDKAVNNPTDVNLANYAYAQRLMVDTGSRFSSRMIEFMATESLLDEDRRRPTSGFALNAFKSEKYQVIKDAIQKAHAGSKGLFFFYSSDCGYCHKMVPVLNEFALNHKMKILGISMDGGVIPGMEGFELVNDSNHEVSKQFNIRVTPTLHMVLNDNSTKLVAEGLKALPDVEERFIVAAYKGNAIDKETYDKTRSVREIDVYRGQDGNLLADKGRLESEPEYLQALLQEQLKDSAQFGTKVVLK
jgi:conjugal transfer pilus assembly protein TraF